MIKLHNWSIHFKEGTDAYTPPECIKKVLVGNVYGHQKHDDGKLITTSSIVSIDKRIVQTSSGSVYRLGKIDPDYRKFLKKEIKNWNWRNPIKIGDLSNSGEIN